MSALHDIIRTVTQNGMTKRELFSHFGDPNSRQHKLVLGITDDTFKTDDEAITVLYGSVDASTKRMFKQLKYNVRGKLLGLLFTMPDEEGALNDRRKVHAEALKLAAAGKILFINSYTDTAEDVLIQAVRKAREHEFFDVEYHALCNLQSHYSTQGEQKKRVDVRQRMEYLMEMLNAEMNAREHFNHFTTIASKTTGYSARAAIVAEEVVENLRMLAKDYPCFSIRNWYRKAEMFRWMLHDDYEKALESVRGTIELLEEYPRFATQTLYADSYMQSGYCHYELQDYQTALAENTRALELSKPQTYNWANVLKLRLLTLLRMEDFPAFMAELRTAYEYIGNGGGTDFWREQIQLLHGYFAWLCRAMQRTGVEVAPAALEIAAQFSINDFMIASPNITADKKGTNVARVILDVMFLLIDNPDGAEVRLEALLQYRKQYLRGRQFARTSAFIHLVELLFTNNFDMQTVLDLGKKERALLNPSVKNKNCVSESFEPIPLLRTWGFAEAIYPAYAVHSSVAV